MKLYDELVWRGLINDISSPELEKKLNDILLFSFVVINNI